MLSRNPWLRHALCLAALTGATATASAQQTVFLDFSQPAVFGPGVEDFTTADRDTIQAAIEQDFQAFNFSFTQTAPTSGDFSTIRFNVGSTISSVGKVDFRNQDRNDVGFVRTADEFDSFETFDDGVFPNLIRQRSNFLQFTANIASRTVGQLVGLEQFDALGPIGSGFSPEQGFLVDPSTVDQPPFLVSTDFRPYFVADPLFPVLDESRFNGPRNASQTSQHLSGSLLTTENREFIEPVLDGFGLPTFDPMTGEPVVESIFRDVYIFETDKRQLVLSNPVDPTSPVNTVIDQFFGPRAAVKLAFNEQATIQAELDNSAKQTVQRPAGPISVDVKVQELQLTTLNVPTTAEDGPLARRIVTSQAAAVAGELVAQDAGGRDLYAFNAAAGDTVNIEVKSALLDRFENDIDAIVSVLDSNFQPIDYYGVDAVSDDELVRFPLQFGDPGFENGPQTPKERADSTDARLLDLLIPADGTYFIEVQSFRNNPSIFDDTGEYELFFHNSRAVDAPVGDFNVDGVVDLADYTLWRDTFDDDVVPFTGADADGNGKIDLNDYDQWVANFGTVVDFSAPATSTLLVGVPEPSAAGLVLLAMLAGATRRRG